MDLSPKAALSAHPLIEVGVRRAYWSNRWLHERLQRVSRAPSTVETQPEMDLLPDMLDAIQSLGVRPGDTLIVHSGNDAILNVGARPRAINQGLLQLLGPHGTLVMPAYPVLKEEPQGFDYMHHKGELSIIRFDVRKTPPWTGVLGMDLMRMPGAIRSRLPINTLAAVGAEASAMFEHELDRTIPHPCGQGTAWDYCASTNAKVLALGTDLAHSITLNHVAEDLHPDAWPVRNWYRLRDYETQEGEAVIRGQIWERRPKWAQYYGERTLARDIVRDGVTKRTVVAGISLQLVEARQHLAYLRARRTSTYPYFNIPRRSRRDPL